MHMQYDAITLLFRYAGRFDCGCVYECVFSLLDKAKNVIDDFKFRANINQWEGGKWHKVRISLNHCVFLRK